MSKEASDPDQEEPEKLPSETARSSQDATEEKKNDEKKVEPQPQPESKSKLRSKSSDTDGKPVAAKKAAAVNFQDTCELYEIDLENGTRNKEIIRLKPSAHKSLRYYIMMLALISPFVTTYSRTIINFAIIDMIEPDLIEKKSDNQQVALNLTDKQYFDRDNSCPVSEDVRERLIKENKKDIRLAGKGEKYPWDTLKQGLLKGAYAIGHALFQVAGSRLSEMFGSREVMSICSLLIAVCCLTAPYLAAASFYLLFIDLFLLGVLGSFMTPSLITLIANWLTPGEKSMMMSCYLVASRLGYALSSILCGALIAWDLSWRWVFFSAGWISLTYSIAFFLIARSTPKEHPLSSQLELDYLANKNTLVRESLKNRVSGGPKSEQKELELVGSGAQPKEKQTHEETTKKVAPWLAICTSAPVWAFVITKFCVKMAGDTVQIELPGYMKRVMHLSFMDNGWFNFWNYVIFCFSCLFAGFLSKYAIKKRPYGFEKTAIRKCFQCFASFSVSLALAGIAFSVCHQTSTQIWMFMLFFTTSFSIGGEAQIPLDITERYPGTIHAIGSSLAVSGFIEPVIVGFITKNHEADRDIWKVVWLGASAISFAGGLVFLIFADATIQPFDSFGSESSAEKPVKETSIEGVNNEAYVKDDEIATTVRENEDNGKPFRESIQI